MSPVAASVSPTTYRPMVELGATGLQVFGGAVQEEWLRALRGGERLRRAMREMAENDDTVGAMLYAVEMLLRQVEWSVEPHPDARDRADEQRAEFLESCLTDMSHTWDDFLTEWMAAPVYGFAPFEVVYKRRVGPHERDPAKRSKHSDGFVGVRKLAIRHPTSLARWLFDESGGVRGMEQEVVGQVRGGGRSRIVALPIEKLLLFRIRARKGNPEGTPLLRNAYVPYVRKKRISEIEAIGIERDLGGIPLIYAPAQWFAPQASGDERALLEAVRRIGENLRNDEQACVVMPSLFDPDTNERVLSIELLGQGGGGRRAAMDTGGVIERYDRRILMTILADVIMLGHEKVGSYALASSKTNLFATGLGALLDSIDDVVNRHLVPRLWLLNGWPLDRLPEVRHGDVESVDIAQLAEYVAKLAGAGAPLFPDEELEAHLRRAANLPPKGEEAAEAQALMRAATEAARAAAAGATVDSDNGTAPPGRRPRTIEPGGVGVSGPAPAG